MFTKRAREGYVMIDHRNSPGVPVEMAVAAGLDPSAAGSTLFESATITCKHCNRPVVLNPNRSRGRHYCRSCDGYICDQCAVLKDCRPFERVLADVYTQLIKRA